MADDGHIHHTQNSYCSQITHNTLWWMIIGCHVYIIVSGSSPFGIL